MSKNIYESVKKSFEQSFLNEGKMTEDPSQIKDPEKEIKQLAEETEEEIGGEEEEAVEKSEEEEKEEEQEEKTPNISSMSDEEIAELKADMPDVDDAEFRAGLAVEMEHWYTVDKCLMTVAKIVIDHLKESPKYYAYLAEMEVKMKEDEKAIEQPEEEAPVEEPKEPISTEESKLPVDPSQVKEPEKEIQMLAEDTLKYVPKGSYEISDAEGKGKGEYTTLDVAVEGNVVKEVDGKKVIKLKKMKADEADRYILTEKVEDKKEEK